MATPATPPAPAPAVAVIPGFQLYNSLVSTSTTIIDTRPRKDFDSLHPCTAISLPLENLPEDFSVRDVTNACNRSLNAICMRKRVTICTAAPITLQDLLDLPPKLAKLIQYLQSNSINTNVELLREGLTVWEADYPYVCRVTHTPGIFEDAESFGRVEFQVKDLPTEVLNGGEAAVDKDILAALRISCVISMCVEIEVPATEMPQISFLACPCDDIPSFPINNFFDKAFAFLDDALAKHQKVLVHCAMGISRSSSMVIAYIMYHKRWGFREAYAWVKQCRPCIDPNPGFVRRLRDLEVSLGVPSST